MWKKLDPKNLPRNCGALLVTNNIDARDAFDRRSHVWLVDMVHVCEIEAWGIYAFDDAGRRQPMNLTHYIPLADVDRLVQERDEARQFAEMAAKKYNDFLVECANNTAVTCAFCAAIFPPGTPRHGDGELAAHIKVCEKHPLRAAESQLAAVTQELEAWKSSGAKTRLDALRRLQPRIAAEVKSWEDAAAEAPGGDRGEAHDISTVKLLDAVLALLSAPSTHHCEENDERTDAIART